MSKLSYEFYHRPCLDVARDLVGKVLVHGELRLRITETEAYCGESDTACHASKGRTKRTEVMYQKAGTIYIYLCYGIHWMLNIVTGEENEPEAVLIRACEGKFGGPGKLTKALGITGSLPMSRHHRQTGGHRLRKRGGPGAALALSDAGKKRCQNMSKTPTCPMPCRGVYYT